MSGCLFFSCTFGRQIDVCELVGAGLLGMACSLYEFARRAGVLKAVGGFVSQSFSGRLDMLTASAAAWWY